jgi:hypothetical protein
VRDFRQSRVLFDIVKNATRLVGEEIVMSERGRPARIFLSTNVHASRKAGGRARSDVISL